jgi:predicted O-linked N-acetylglucosamine transferase (SPINDLY family)
MPVDPKRRIGLTPSRRAAGLPERGFVFCSFNNSYKIGPEMFDIWMRLLTNVEDSVFWLSAANPTAARHLRREAEARGVHAERLIFAPFVEAAEDHLARLRLADLFLDTLPCNAHTTANDALIAGVPLLTRPGHGFAGRVASSLLAAAGLSELIAKTAEDYEAMALGFARAPSSLAALRAKLENNRGLAPLFDSAGFCRALEEAYRHMHERAQRGEAPASFAVPGASGH